MKFKVKMVETTVTEFEYEVSNAYIREDYDIEKGLSDEEIAQRVIDIDTESLESFEFNPDDFSIPRCTDIEEIDSKRKVKIKRVE